MPKLIATHEVDDHPLLKGINFIYEGATISHIQPCKELETVLTASDGQILAAVPTARRQNVVVDCGFTRYFRDYVTKTAGTVRYGTNVAAYLMGKRR